MSEIADWLNRIGFGHFADAFQSNGIELESLEEVTNDDLKDIGVSKLSDRKNLLKEIERLLRERTQAAGERRLLTVLFCDLVGFTVLSQQLDPEELRRALRRYQDTTRKSITKYGGMVANYVGDGVMAYFGWPRADEDQAGQAVRAALDIVRALAQLEVELGIKLRCRVGIATGRVVVGGEKHLDSAFGETPNLAARLQSAAGEDRVVVDRVTRHLIGHGFRMEPLGPVVLKGFDQPVEHWEVAEERKYLDRFESRPGGSSQFAGRNEELRILSQIWQSIEERRGQTCLIRGEAGIGKSRLVREFELAVRQENFPVLRYQCSPYHTNSAFHPVIQHLARAAGFSPQDEPASAKLAKISSLFEDAISEDPKVRELLADLLSIPHDMATGLTALSAPQRRLLTIAVLANQAVLLSRPGPILVILEDAHWTDPSTLELLQELIKRAAQERVFTMVTTRPGRELQLPGTPTELALTRLSDADVAAIAKSMKGADDLSDRDVATIVARVDGIPLFAEELTSTLLGRKVDDHRLDLPENIQASVMARLDMLGGAKYAAQVGSVMGMEFKHAQLSALATAAVPDLDESIAGLVQSGLLLEAGARDKSYRFKHALVRDVAYESLLREHRRQLHERLVRDVISDDDKERAPELVAHHLTEAGLIVEALDHWKKAGYRASRASANLEAIAHFTRGLALIRELPGDGAHEHLELGFQVGLTGPVIASKGYTSEELKAVISRALALSKKVDNAPEIFSVLYSRWGFLLTAGSILESYGVALEFSSLAERQGNQDALYARYRMLGASRMCLGELEEAGRDLDRAISLYVKEEHERLLTAYGVDIRVAARCFQGEVLWLKGYPDGARRSVALALQEAKEIGHSHSIAMSLYFCGLVSLLYRDHDAVRDYMEELMALGTRQSIGGWPTLGGTILGWSRVADGKLDDGLAMMNKGMDTAEKVGISMFMPFLKCRMGEILLSLDRIAEAERAVAEAEAIMDRTAERNYEGELRRLKGELHWRNAQVEAAEVQFREALEIARRQKAKTVELRATTSYARFLAAHGQADRARALVASVEAWFDEGKGGHDLAAARAVIDSLSDAAGSVEDRA
jgi:class 3 adenylate cyclase/tetratricopeptide (TPR) repeat protein/ABC-type transport system involved in cytochrome c biogenesis ATPase subunit